MILSLLLFLPLVSGDCGCKTPMNETGDCRSLKNCSALVELLQQQQPSATSLVKESICGFRDLEALVCCPLPPPRNTSTSPSLSTAPTRVTDGSEEVQCGRVHFQTDKIVGGENAELGDWPWLAALGYKSLRNTSAIRWLCGGALVTKRHIITAAHCINIGSGREPTVVRLGDLNLEEVVADGATPLDVEVDRTISHPGYEATSKENDIAIVKLNSDVPFSDNIRPICLPKTSYFNSSSLAEQIVTVAGWGRLEFGGPSSEKLQQVELKITDDDTCRNAYSSFKPVVVDNRVMCAGTPGKSACQGDSGGPLVLVHNLTYYMVGLVSYGKGCGEPGYPGVATRVSSFMDWITANLN